MVARKKLMLYEALELRDEYTYRAKVLRSLMPENANSFNYGTTIEVIDGFDVKLCRETISNLEVKKRKLNNAIQNANFTAKVTIGGEEMSLYEALNDRKATIVKTQELEQLLPMSNYCVIEHKEDRDIKQRPKQDYKWCRDTMENRILHLRALNRAIRKASHEVEVDFFDEN